ncbi:hypothetical protein GGR52DRAFT_549627 [Hypoxylon sp. FL1284]|nr:hypothetical protein GGR52DRAFT_549627 [Hypoxylon sp. FL1284]
MTFTDAAIIGGDPAGLTAPATLARQPHTAAGLDDGGYRDARASHMHTVPTWDPKDPAACKCGKKQQHCGCLPCVHRTSQPNTDNESAPSSSPPTASTATATRTAPPRRPASRPSTRGGAARRRGRHAVHAR